MTTDSPEPVTSHRSVSSSPPEAPPTHATAFGPASIGNVAVGYDVLGCAFEAVGDRVRVERLPERTVEIRAITGLPMELPRAPEDNTAAVALVRLIEERELDFGFAIGIEKGIPLGSGMGGSAASAVAAIRAASALLDAPLDRAEMLHFALQGEAVASGAVHADNVAPSLYGGLVLTRSVDPPDVIPIPVPDALRCVLVRPDLQIATRDARAVLPDDVPLQTAVQQSANLAGLIAGCLQSDFELIGRALRDVMIEPHRKGLIPAFDAVQQAALDAGALGCSISGAGPSLFAWCRAADAKAVHGAMRQAFDDADVTAEGWVTAVTATGAHLVDPSDRT